jgi:acyl carrier protein
MPDLHDRLVRCFSAVFPDLSDEQIRSASTESLSAWDSLAAVTLVAVLQQEFGLEIDLGDLEKLISFERAKSYIIDSQDQGHV